MVPKTLGNYVLVRIGVQFCAVETQNNTGLNKIEIYFSLTNESCSQALSPATTRSPHSSQREEGERERGHCFHLSFMTWKCHISLLLISHGPELSDVATPGSKGGLRRGLSVFPLGSLAWKRTWRLALRQCHFLHASYEAKTICDFRLDSSHRLVFGKSYSLHSLPPGSSMGIKFDAPYFWIWIFFLSKEKCVYRMECMK